MTEKCMVCKAEINIGDTKCPVCGFADLHKDFISKEDAENWMKAVVEPYREKYNEGLKKSQKPKYDSAGFDEEGYNKYGFNKIAGLNHEGYERQGYSNSGYREPERKKIEDILVPIRVACLVIFGILFLIHGFGVLENNDTIPFWVPLIPLLVIFFLNMRYENK